MHKHNEKNYLERDGVPIDCIAQNLWVVMAGEQGLAVDE
jgi:hypothetical protein